jgi:hypothetical protein
MSNITVGAITDGAITDGAITDGAITDGAITDGAITDGAMVTPTLTLMGAIILTPILNPYLGFGFGAANLGKRRWLSFAALRGSAALLAGCLFDDRGNRMSPTHANKRGVRYRYYLSHAILQNRKAEAGSIGRLPAPEIKSLVLRQRAHSHG